MTLFATLCLWTLSLMSCTHNTEIPDEPDPDPIEKPQIKAELQEVKLYEYPNAEISIDQTAASINAVLPYGSVLGSATIGYKVEEGVKVDPSDGSTVDLRKSFNIFVTAPSGASKKYSFSAKLAPSDAVKIKWLMAKDYYIKAENYGTEYLFTLPYGADLSKVKIDIASDYALTSEPELSEGIDLSKPCEVKVFAEDGKAYKSITIRAETYAKDTGVRGVYLPSPAHTSTFSSYSELCKSMDLLQELNFNCLYVCAWAQTKTAWDSEVLYQNSTYSSPKEGNMYKSYSGGSGDAIADMISEGEKRGIKVILWFEYGFMHGIGSVNKSDPLLSKHPDWIGLNSEGGYCNYNGTDYYLNSYSEEVQNFMIDLMLEAVKRYPGLAGIQGDDRLPASPVNAGYNEATLNAYMEQTGKGYPSSYNDSDWMAWRLQNLNDFALKMHDAIKAADSSVLVCFAPNKYPWACNNLSQDWPSWVKSGAAQLVTVQCYVTANYERDLDSQMSYMHSLSDKVILQPAMILKNGPNLLSPELLSEQLCYNRKVGSLGEAQFWFEGLLNEDLKQIFKLFYSYPVEFPEL
ncbi:MAG: family 10 glycosylhydrolase [Candidatus Cryptobacteroides sp.]